MTFCISIIFMIYPIKTAHMVRKYRSRDYTETARRRRLDIHRVENIINTPSGVMLYSQRTWNTRVGKSRIDTGERETLDCVLYIPENIKQHQQQQLKAVAAQVRKLDFGIFSLFRVWIFIWAFTKERMKEEVLMRSFFFYFLLKRSFGDGYGSHGPHKKELFVQKACNQSRLKCSNPILNYICIKQGVAEYISSRLCQSGRLSHNTFQSIRAQ